MARHQGLSDKIELEDIGQHLDDLKQGVDMVCRSLAASYKYTNKLWAKMESGFRHKIAMKFLLTKPEKNLY